MPTLYQSDRVAGNNGTYDCHGTFLEARPAQPLFACRTPFFASRSVLARTLKHHGPTPGHAIAAVRALESGLWVTAGGEAPPAAIQKGTRVLISLWDSLMFGRVPKNAAPKNGPCSGTGATPR